MIKPQPKLLREAIAGFYKKHPTISFKMFSELDDDAASNGSLFDESSEDESADELYLVDEVILAHLPGEVQNALESEEAARDDFAVFDSDFLAIQGRYVQTFLESEAGKSYQKKHDERFKALTRELNGLKKEVDEAERLCKSMSLPGARNVLLRVVVAADLHELRAHLVVRAMHGIPHG